MEDGSDWNTSSYPQCIFSSAWNILCRQQIKGFCPFCQHQAVLSLRSEGMSLHSGARRAVLRCWQTRGAVWQCHKSRLEPGLAFHGGSPLGRVLLWWHCPAPAWLRSQEQTLWVLQCAVHKIKPPTPLANQVRTCVRDYLLCARNCQGYKIQISHRELHSLNKFLPHLTFDKKVSVCIFKEYWGYKRVIPFLFFYLFWG